MRIPVYQALARLLLARATCERTGNHEWRARHSQRVCMLAGSMLPSGGGFDNGCILILEDSRPDRLVFTADYHHMDDEGFYCGWSDHKVVVTPSLAFGFKLRVTGKNWRDVKDYIHQCFDGAMSAKTDA